MGTIEAAPVTSDGDPPLKSGESGRAVEPQSLLAFAEALLHRGCLDEAKAAYRELLEQDQTRLKALIALGNIERRLGDDTAASAFLGAAISIDPDHLRALTDLAAVLRDLNRPLAAMSIYRKILATREKHVPSHMGLAWIARESRNDEGAIEHFGIAAECLRAASARDPNDMRMLSELGTALRELGRLEEAAAIYRNVLTHQPGHAPSHIGLGWIARKSGNDEVALEHFKAASELKPADLQPRIMLARVLALMGRFEESESVYRRVLLEAPNHLRARAALGVLARTRQDWAGAAEHFRAAAQSDPRSVPFRIELGHALYQLSKWEDAERIYRSALEDSPGTLEAILGLAETAKARGDSESALAWFEKAAAAAPLDLRPKQELRRLKIAVGVYDWRTEVDEAVAVARSPGASVETQIEAAKILVEYGLTEVARPVLSRLEAGVPAARQLLLIVRQIERTGLAQPLAEATGDADPATHQLESLRGFLEMPVPNASTLLIVFGGTNNRVSITFSLLHKILRKAGVSIIYCRDLRQEWYSRGVVGLGADFESTVAGFNALARRYGANRILTLGNCVGCQGALRFGLCLNADGVLGLDPKIRPGSLGPHHRTQLAAIRCYLPAGRRLIQDQYASTSSRPKVTLIFGEHHAVDASGVRSMADVPGVAVAGLPDSTDPVKDLLVRGLLEPVLREFVAHGTVSQELRAQISSSCAPQIGN